MSPEPGRLHGLDRLREISEFQAFHATLLPFEGLGGHTLCQQNIENIMPTYSMGSVTPGTVVTQCFRRLVG